VGIGDFDRSVFSVPNLSTPLFSDLAMSETELPFISNAILLNAVVEFSGSLFYDAIADWIDT
jgi:hypothetical protein